MKNEHNRNLIMLTGTPITTPADVYGYAKLIDKMMYRSQWQFDVLHIADKDFFGNVSRWKNHDLLNKNFMQNGARVLREEVSEGYVRPDYEVIPYELAPAHKALYDRLAADALLELEGKDSIDFLTQSGLHSALQQVIIGYENYFETPKEKAKARSMIQGFEVLDTVMEILAGKKLLLFAYYQRSIDAIVAHGEQYGAVALNGRVSAKQKQLNIEKFLNDPDCRLLVAQPESAGSGLDDLKHVCSNVLFLELPMIPKDFVQAVGRIDRTGQKEFCKVWVACAIGTLQVRRQKMLLAKDAEANKIQMTVEDLKDLLGGS